MLDLHCHILPGVDDGPATLDEALSLARFCVRDGITHITATPHCNPAWRWLRADILPEVERFNGALAKAGVPLTVLPGSEIQVTDSAAYRQEFEAGLFCHLGDSSTFTLLEFPWHGAHYPSAAPDLITWLRDRGMTPIVAHPERQSFFQHDSARLQALIEAGAWLQITVDSLLGNHGAAPQAAAASLLRTDAEAILATDAHNLQRCSGLSAGYSWVAEHLGAPKAAELRSRSDHVLAVLTGGA